MDGPRNDPTRRYRLRQRLSPNELLVDGRIHDMTLSGDPHWRTLPSAAREGRMSRLGLGSPGAHVGATATREVRREVVKVAATTAGSRSSHCRPDPDRPNESTNGEEGQDNQDHHPRPRTTSVESSKRRHGISPGEVVLV